MSNSYSSLCSIYRAFLRHSVFDLAGLPFIGIMSTYSGGGYVAELGLSQLQASRYIGNDVEFLLKQSVQILYS